MAGRKQRSVGWAAFGVVVAGSMLLGGCANQPAGSYNDRPDWVSRPEASRNPALFITAVGQGGTVETARTDAVTKLTGAVASRAGRVDVNLGAYQDAVQSAGADPRFTVELLKLERIELTADQIGLRVLEVYRDSNGRCYALGQIDRGQLVQAYDGEIRRNGDLSSTLVNSAAQALTPLSRWEQLDTALLAATARDELIEVRQKLAEPLVEPQRTVPPAEPSVAMIRQQLASIRPSASAVVDRALAGPPSDAVIDDVRGALVKLGVPMEAAPGLTTATPDVRFVIGFVTTPASDSQMQVALVNYRLTVEASDVRTGRLMDTMVIEGKTGGRTEGDARAEAARVARADLGPRLERFLRRAVYGYAPSGK